MIKFCLVKWEAGKKDLKKAFEAMCCHEICSYEILLSMVVQYVLNANVSKEDLEKFDCMDWESRDFLNVTWAKENITAVNDGDYQGTLIFLIPTRTSQPGAGDYLMTDISYGSCSLCDTLQAINDEASSNGNSLTPKQIDLYLQLCKDMLTNMIRPYNHGWRNREIFDIVEVEDDG